MKIAVAGGTGTAGRHTVEAARSAGHQVVVLSRAAGIDLTTPGGDRALEDALDGVEVIIDAANPHTLARGAATAFFEQVAGRLQRSGARAGVARLVTLSIVGVDRVPGFGYYQAKCRHEEVSLAGPLPATIVRATQFHEFPGQILRITRRGPVGVVTAMRTQPIAARTVGAHLLGAATGQAPGSEGTIVQIAGPEPAQLASLARRYLRHRGRRAVVVALPLPGAAGQAMRAGAVLPTDDVPRLGPTFAEWLGTPDADDPDV